MNDRKFFLSVLVGSALFVYLIGSFLVASFDITVWKDAQRNFAVLVYLFFVWGAIKAVTQPEKNQSSTKKQEENRKIEEHSTESV